MFLGENFDQLGTLFLYNEVKIKYRFKNQLPMFDVLSRRQ